MELPPGRDRGCAGGDGNASHPPMFPPDTRLKSRACETAESFARAAYELHRAAQLPTRGNARRAAEPISDKATVARAERPARWPRSQPNRPAPKSSLAAAGVCPAILWVRRA